MYECDIVFLFDTSGSMDSHISKVKDVVENFTNDLQNNDIDYRLGIVAFKNKVSTYDFTDDVDEFKDTVNSILNTSGGYEYGLTAIEEAMKMNFRDEAGKYFVMLTDEPYEESSSKATEIINQLKSNNMRLDVIGYNGYGCDTAYKPITEATGGGFYDIQGHMPKIFQNLIGGVNIPSNAFVYNGHSYYVYSDVNGVNSWEDAKNYCESQGGYLAVIENSAENTALYNYITEQGYKNAYFGLTDSKQEGTWEWTTGDAVAYTNWGSVEPNSERSDEDYAEFYYKYADGKWNDGNFGNGTVGDSKTFICEWDTVTNNGNGGGGNNQTDDDDNLNIDNSNSFFKNMTIVMPTKSEKSQLYNRSTNALSNLIKINGDDVVLKNVDGAKTLSEYLSSQNTAIIGGKTLDIKQTESVFRLIGNLSGHTELKLMADSLASAKSIIDCLKHRNVDLEFGKNLFNEVKNLLKVTNDWGKLQGNKFVKSLGLGIAASVAGLAAVAIASYDDIKTLNITEQEQDDLVKGCINVIGETVKVCCPSLSTSVVGAVDVVSAAAIGVYMGSVTYKRSLDEYSKDGTLSLGDKRDAKIDALMSGLYGFSHKITYEVDDIFFEMVNEASGNKYQGIGYDKQAASGWKSLLGNLDSKISTICLERL